eukprot:3759563-Karenia_brevis.AAC.1
MSYNAQLPSQHGPQAPLAILLAKDIAAQEAKTSALLARTCRRPRSTEECVDGKAGLRGAAQHHGAR